ncbi:MAG: zinc ABC transporter substrate-binding protein [Gammaproteobacteria bacterium]|nr:zinc ABC transporter substrate-binding protein [Gammaproteobacteria bacterium]
MMTLLNYRISIACALLCTQLFCQTARAEETTRSIVAVNYPLHFFARTIGGKEVKAEFPLPPEIDPAYWKPEPREVAIFQRADLVLLNGAGYAGWTAYAALPRRKLVDTSAGFRDRYLSVADQVTHSHGPAGDHSHNTTAFTTWLDLSLAAEQAAAVKQALTRTDPENGQSYARRSDKLEKQLLDLDQRMQSAGKVLSGGPVIFSHPVYQYLERAYAIAGTSLHWEPHKEPDAGQWALLQEIATTSGSRLMIWESDPLTRTRDRLHALGIQVVVFDPMANQPKEGDFLSGMERNVRSLEEAAESLQSQGLVNTRE